MGAAARPTKRWFALGAFLYGTLAALLVAFVVYRRQDLLETVVDLNGFGKLSRSLARGDGFSLGAGPTIRRAPFYPLLGGFLLHLFGTDTPGASAAALYAPLIVANCVAFGFTCVVVWRLTERLFGARVGLAALVFCPLVPQCLRYVGMTEVETFMGLWTVLLAATGLSLAARPGPRTAVAFGVAAAAATLTKPVALLYPIVFGAVAIRDWISLGVPRRVIVQGVGCALGSFLLLLLPWSLRNIAVTDGHFTGISSNAPGEFLRGYVNAQPKYYLLRQDFGGGAPGEKWDPEANVFEDQVLAAHGFDRLGPEYAPPGAMPRFPVSALHEVEKDRIESAEVRSRVLKDPASFLHKFAVQFFTFWYIVETRRRSVLVGLVALAMLVLAGIGTVRAQRTGQLVWPVFAVILYFNVIYAAVLAFARYSMPLFPTIVVLAAGGLASLVERFPRKQPVSTASGGGVQVPAAGAPEQART
ncbi:MAG TPA: hypothetical protein VKU41_07600 [Polyangiaceae bacterium]|nr:hypothetical protein [Polyangiaceae bacterium]